MSIPPTSDRPSRQRNDNYLHNDSKPSLTNTSYPSSDDPLSTLTDTSHTNDFQSLSRRPRSAGSMDRSTANREEQDNRPMPPTRPESVSEYYISIKYRSHPILIRFYQDAIIFCVKTITGLTRQSTSKIRIRYFPSTSNSFSFF